MIPPAFVEELLARVDIVEIVGRQVQLRKTGANHMGLCPFHAEKGPSFSVSAAKQFYHCFGCGAHGNAIGFLMEQGGLGFIEAVKELAGTVGMNVPQEDEDPEARERAQQARARQASLGEVLEHAAGFYRDQLKASADAVAYLKRRGLSAEVTRQFGIGYAPDSWRPLATTFARYDDPLLVESGLVIVSGDEGDEQRRYDRFRGRIMFPIRSVKGEVIGFGGRVLDQGEPKYLNSPETPLFVKGRELYGLFEARQGLRARGHALVVEGYMDVVALAQLGINNAVATLGTACTAEHIQKLLRFTDSVVFSFDGDAAGRRAAARALEAALPHASDTRQFRFLFLPPEHDPDSFVREHGAPAFELQIKQALALSRQLINVAGEGCDTATPEGRARLLATARPLWQALPDAGVLKRQVLGELASLGQMDAADLAEAWGMGQRAVAPRGRNPASRAAAPAPKLRSRPAGPAEHALCLLLQHNEWWDRLSPQDHDLLHQLPGNHGELCAWLERQLHEHGPQPWGMLEAELQGHALQETAQRVMGRMAAQDEGAFEDLRSMVNLLWREQLVARSHELAAQAGSDPAARAEYSAVLARLSALKPAAS